MRISNAAKKRLVIASLVALISLLGVTSCQRHYIIGFNMTESLEGTVYLVFRGDVPTTDQIIAFKSPETRFYPEMMFLKIVKGRSGDTLSWDDQTILINGESLGLAKTVSKDGASMDKTPATTIGKGQFFTWTPHPDSFDSRYIDIGLVDSTRLVGRAVRLL